MASACSDMGVDIKVGGRYLGPPLVNRISTNGDTPTAPRDDDLLAHQLGPDCASRLRF
jgi:hypothetical protein